MGRTQMPKGQIILKKKEKLEAVKAAMPFKYVNEDFAAKFQQMYPDDWSKIVKRFESHESNNKGKGHPMAEPWKYLMNVVKVFHAAAAKNKKAAKP
jgi:hypothetical protein